MKWILTYFLLSTFLSNWINACCSYFEPIDHLDRTKGARIWYVVRRYENGPESKTTCQIVDISNPEFATKKLFYANGTSTIITGNTPFDTKSSNGTVTLTNLSATHPTVIMVTYTDYETIRVSRACFNDEEYLWIYSSKKRPCKKIVEAIDAIIKEQKLDTKQIFTIKCDISDN